MRDKNFQCAQSLCHWQQTAPSHSGEWGLILASQYLWLVAMIHIFVQASDMRCRSSSWCSASHRLHPHPAPVKNKKVHRYSFIFKNNSAWIYNSMLILPFLFIISVNVAFIYQISSNDSNTNYDAYHTSAMYIVTGPFLNLFWDANFTATNIPAARSLQCRSDFIMVQVD